jgi:hypothetical protein
LESAHHAFSLFKHADHTVASPCCRRAIAAGCRQVGGCRLAPGLLAVLDGRAAFIGGITSLRLELRCNKPISIGVLSLDELEAILRRYFTNVTIPGDAPLRRR